MPVRLATNVQVAYFDQMREVLDPEISVTESGRRFDMREAAQY
jgi:hypothetical protein